LVCGNNASANWEFRARPPYTHAIECGRWRDHWKHLNIKELWRQSASARNPSSAPRALFIHSAACHWI
jgi:hypothetical protein